MSDVSRPEDEASWRPEDEASLPEGGEVSSKEDLLREETTGSDEAPGSETPREDTIARAKRGDPASAERVRRERIRRGLGYFVDACLVAGLCWVIVALPYDPDSRRPEDITAAALRLALIAAVSVRLGIRLMPIALNVIESFDVRALLAARHLRARKANGFLTAISVLSLLAVSFSSCALATTLSVMGGFRNDLKQKILGNHAHIVAELREGEGATWKRDLAVMRAHPEVTGASPFVSGEVMMSSASNLSGVVLRGVDLDSVGDVSDLPRNMEEGDLTHLLHPEQIAPPSLNTRGSLHLPMLTGKAAQRADADRESEESEKREAEQGRERDGEQRDGEQNREQGAPPSSADKVEASKPVPYDLDAPPGIVVGRELARVLRLSVADDVQMVAPFGTMGPSGPMPKTQTFRVAGIFYSGMYEYDMKYVYTQRDTARRFLGTDKAISGIEAKTRDVEDAPMVAAALRCRLPKDAYQVKDWKELNQNLFGALALEKVAMFITLGIAILVAGFCVFGTLTLMVQEKTREVAILRAIGATRRLVMGIFMMEGFLLGLLGAWVGLGLGFLACFLATHFGIRLDPEVYYIDRLPVEIDGWEFLWVGIASVGICTVATLFPAFMSTTTRPADALRFE